MSDAEDSDDGLFSYETKELAISDSSDGSSSEDELLSSSSGAKRRKTAATAAAARYTPPNPFHWSVVGRERTWSCGFGWG